MFVPPLRRQRRSAVRRRSTADAGRRAGTREGRRDVVQPGRCGHPRRLPVRGLCDHFSRMCRASTSRAQSPKSVTGWRVGTLVTPSWGCLRWMGDGSCGRSTWIAPAEVLTTAPRSVALGYEPPRCRPSGLTAWQALFEVVAWKAGQTILINGAGGAVGGYAVQLAEQAGAVCHCDCIGAQRDPAAPLRSRPAHRLHRLHSHPDRRRRKAVRRRAEPGRGLHRSRPRRLVGRRRRTVGSTSAP